MHQWFTFTLIRKPVDSVMSTIDKTNHNTRDTIANDLGWKTGNACGQKNTQNTNALHNYFTNNFIVILPFNNQRLKNTSHNHYYVK